MAARTRLEWGLWIYGLLSAFIGGGAGAFTAGPAAAMIAPEKFNLADPWPLCTLMLVTFIGSGLTPFFAYLKQHPLPSIITTTRTETMSLKQEDPPVIVKQTVETTKEEKPE